MALSNRFSRFARPLNVVKAGLLCALLAGLQSSPCAAQVNVGSSPRPPSQREEPAPPRAAVFDASLEGAKAIDAAIAKARPLSKYVLIVWGEESQKKATDMLHYILNYSDMPIDLHYEYELVKLEIGEDAGDAAKANRALAKSMNVPLKDGDVRHGVMTVIDLDKKVIAHKALEETVITRTGMDVYDIVAVKPFLIEHKPKLPSADSMLEEALKRAASEHKGVLVRFSEPWCIWCKRFDAVLEQPAVAAALATAAVTVEVDTARNPGGMALLSRIGTEFVDGIPYYVFLDEKGNVAARSQADEKKEENAKPEADATADGAKKPKPIKKRAADAPKNIGYPSSNEEIAAFEALLRQAKPPVADAQVKIIGDAFRAARGKLQTEEHATEQSAR